MIKICCEWLGVDWNIEGANKHGLHYKIYIKIRNVLAEESDLIDQEIAHIYYGIIYSEVQEYKSKFDLKFTPIAFNNKVIWDLVCMDIAVIIPLNILKNNTYGCIWNEEVILNVDIIAYACSLQNKRQKVFMKEYVDSINSVEDIYKVRESAVNVIDLINRSIKSITDCELMDLEFTLKQVDKFVTEY